MKIRIIIALIGCFIAASLTNLNAQDKHWGVGILTGSANSANVLYQFSDKHSLNLSGLFNTQRSFHMSLDFNSRNYEKTTVSHGKLPIYYGAGVEIWDTDNTESGFDFGIRIPAGLIYKPDSFPVEIFAELAPMINFDILRLQNQLGLRFLF